MLIELSLLPPNIVQQILQIQQGAVVQLTHHDAILNSFLLIHLIEKYLCKSHLLKNFI